MSSRYGENLSLTIFGQSHSTAIGMTLEGVPAGIRIDMDELNSFLLRRAPGRSDLSTARKEADLPEFISGLVETTTCGTPITAIIRNTDARRQDYDSFVSVPRPGHADFTAEIKYFGHQDRSGGGHFSGRLTAPLCIAGGICMQILKNCGISVFSRIESIGNVRDEGDFSSPIACDFPTVSASQGDKMRTLIRSVKDAGDSVGGVIECIVAGLPAGLGDPMFGGMENRISSAVFAIPAVKAIEFGDGFYSSSQLGSENNDAFCVNNGIIVTNTNHCGGILGGITNGMPLRFRVGIKPTPSIAAVQKSVDLSTLTPAEISIPGRHDPCIVPRALPCVESVAALAVYDAYLGRMKEINR